MEQNAEKKSVAMILTYSELKAKIDEAGGMLPFIEQLKAGGHTHVGLLPDDWSDRVEKAVEDRAQIVMAIDPGSDAMAIRRFLIDQRGMRGGQSPIITIDDAGFFPVEFSKGELDRRMQVVMDDLQFKMPVFPEAVLCPEAEPEQTESKGPRKRSKYQRGNWWNR